MTKPYNIPSRWLQGCTLSGKTVQEAVATWIEQERLEVLWKAEHDA